MLSTGAAFYRLRDGLAAIYDEAEAAAIAHLALDHLTGLGRLQRLSRKDEELASAAMEQFTAMEAALLGGTPLQYVMGEAYFMNRRFAVNGDVLIPRPETEELVAWIISAKPAGRLVDIGTGSGCIAISIALALPDTRVLAIDISECALAIAAENARALNAKVQLDQLDFLDEEVRDALEAFDVIVSNPPYIPLTERDALHVNVRDHEPPTALFVPGDDALQFYRAIADFGLTHLTAEGSIYCELHHDYAEDARDLFLNYGYADVLLKADMQGAPRMLRARRK